MGMKSCNVKIILFSSFLLKRNKNVSSSVFPDYFLEDCIQMTNFVPPPTDRKKKKEKEEDGEDMEKEVR